MESKTNLKNNYVEMKNEALSQIEELESILQKVDNTKTKALEPLKRTLKKPLFSIAITGPARVGKSTLINALLYKNISPIEVLPTTGIPCQFEPDYESKIMVTLKDGNVENDTVDINNLKKWVTIDGNKNNEKNVDHVIIKIDSKILNLGLTILDLPGLDDPSDTVRNMAEMALEAVDGIVYIMDGSQFATGSFMFRHSDKEALENLVPRKQKTFILINKSDKLNKEQKKALSDYIKKEFKRFDLMQLTSANLFFINAKSAFDNRCSNNDIDIEKGFLKFEKHLWNYLFKNSEIGRNRITGVLIAITNIVVDQVSLSALQLSHSEKSFELKKYIVDLSKVGNLVDQTCSDGFKNSIGEVHSRLSKESDRTLKRYSQSLNEIPWYNPLPNRSRIKRALEQAITNMANIARIEAQTSFNKWAKIANSKVHEIVSSLRKDIWTLLPESKFHSPKVAIGDSLSANPMPPFLGSVGLGLVGLLFGPIGVVVGSIVGLFLGLFVSEKNKRDREIEDVIGKSRKILYNAADTISEYYERVLGDSYQELRIGLQNRLNSVQESLEEQLEKIGEPLSQERESVIKTGIDHLHILEPKIQDLINRFE